MTFRDAAERHHSVTQNRDSIVTCLWQPRLLYIWGTLLVANEWEYHETKWSIVLYWKNQSWETNGMISITFRRNMFKFFISSRIAFPNFKWYRQVLSQNGRYNDDDMNYVANLRLVGIKRSSILIVIAIMVRISFVMSTLKRIPARKETRWAKKFHS